MPQDFARGVITKLTTFGGRKKEPGFTMKVLTAQPVIASPASFQTTSATIRLGDKHVNYRALKVGETVEVAFYEFPATGPRTATQVLITKTVGG